MRTVAVYGNCLLLSGIGASLQRRTKEHVVFFDPALPETTERLHALRPDVVVFDMASACPDSVIALWKARPHLLLIGVDLAKDQVLVLSGQTSRMVSADDLVEVIEGQS